MSLLLLLLACQPDGGCGNLIDVACDDDGENCTCASGPRAGDPCTLGSGGPRDCEERCLYCDAPEPAGPPSVLLGG